MHGAGLAEIASFLRWWGRSLARLVPIGLRRALAGRRARLVAIAGPEIELRQVSGGRFADAGTLDTLGARERVRLARLAKRGRLDVALMLPDHMLGRRQVELPAAAEADLQKVLGFEIDRLTPFQQSELYYAGEIVARDRERGTVEVAVTYAPKASVSDSLDRLEQAGFAATCLGAADEAQDDSALPSPNLMPAPPSRTWTTGRTLASILCLAAIGLGAGLWWQAMNAREAKIATLETELADLRRSLLQSQMDALPPGAEAALAAHDIKTGAMPMIGLLDRLTDMIPDGTSIAVLEFGEGRIRLTGDSDDPAGLVGLFEEAPDFADPSFEAPITRDGSDGRARFLLSLRSTGLAP